MTDIHSHQLEALAMMIERETDSFNAPTKFPSLWRVTTAEGRSKSAHSLQYSSAGRSML